MAFCGHRLDIPLPRALSTMTNKSEAAHGPNVRAYLTVFGLLLFLTVVTVLVSYWHLPIALAVAVALAIATLKSALVAAVFMHLKGERVIIYGLLGMTIFFVTVLIIASSFDTVAISKDSSRAPVAVQAGP